MPATLEVTAESRRRRDHGRHAQGASGPRRAVPSREHRLEHGHQILQEFPRHRRGLERAAPPRARRRLRRRDGRFQGAHRQGRARRAAYRAARREAAFDVIMSGEATPSQIGGFLMALRVRGETVDEIAGAVAIDARQDAAGRSAARRHRRGRHRRRRRRHLQHLDHRRLRRRRRRRARRQARQPRPLLEVRRRRRAHGARASRSTSRRRRSRAASARPASASCSRRRIIRR